MRHRHHGCGPSGHVEINLPAALMAMRGGRGWQGNWGPFHFDFGDEGWSGARSGRRARRMFESGELRLVLLKLIADEPRHGYDLIRAIEDLTGGEYAPSPGIVYPTLTLLQDMGLIEEAPGRATATLLRLTELLRRVLRSDGHLSTLGAEVSLVVAYLDIEQARFKKRLSVEIDVPAALLAATDPAEVPDRWQDVDVVPGKLFFVGDPKQSIYRFRRADIALYSQAQTAFDADPVRLTANFRSVPDVLSWVNRVFGELIVDDGDAQPPYIDLDPHRTTTGAPPGE